MNEEDIKEFINYIKNDLHKIFDIVKCIEKDVPSSVSYKSAMEYIQNLSSRINKFQEFLKNLLNNEQS